MIKIFFVILNYVYLSLAISNDRVVENIRISNDYKKSITRIVFDLSEKTPYSAFTLNAKPRLVIDIEANKVRNSTSINKKIIKNIRISKNEKGVMRIVFDLTKKSYILKHFYIKKGENKYHRLVIDIKEIKNLNKAINKKKRKTSNFIITIDAGHGGIDPGAINLGYKEKDITLKAAIELKKILREKGYIVYLTRKKDKFISLRERRLIAKKNKSDLFISLHVDSVRKRATRGTSIYTLSEKASDRITARLAERENKVDLIAGVNLEKVDDEVASILLDLTRRDTKNSSAEFAEKYIELARNNGHRLLKRPHRHAGFAVLKSPDIPAVLIELGFLSNSKDVKLLSNPKTRKRLIYTLSKSIDEYFKIKLKNFN